MGLQGVAHMTRCHILSDVHYSSLSNTRCRVLGVSLLLDQDVHDVAAVHMFSAVVLE